MSKEAMKLALEALSPWAGEDANHTEQYAAYQALREALAEQPAQQEPVAWRVKVETKLRDGSVDFGYQLRNERLSKYDEPLYTSPPAAKQELVEMSPEFTDTARSALLWVLWHHQGGRSPVGQPIRFALGMSANERLNDWQISEAKRWAKQTNSTTAEFHQSASSPPAQRKPWVGLTEQEAAECWSTSTVRTWQAIEAKLREKNA